MAPKDSNDEAGAQAPQEDFAAMLAEFDQKDGGQARQQKKDPKVGEQVSGKVISVGHEAVFVDLGTKSEAMIDMAELRDAEGKVTIAVGDTVQARVVEVGGKAGCIVLRRSAIGRGAEAKAELLSAYQNGIPVEGMVTAVNKGGVDVEIAKTRGFCPISQLELRHVEDATKFVGQRYAFKITRYEIEGTRVNLVVSRRALLEEEQAQAAVQTRKTLAVGAVMRGTVTGLRDFGAFVDLGGVEGLIHVSELGFQRVGHPKDVLAIGQSVEVQVVKIEQTGDAKRPEKIGLSLKSLEKDPWGEIAERFPVGARVRGTVARIETFGAFVELAQGVDGLLHVSELAVGKKIMHPREVVKPGQLVEVVVLSVDPEKHRISLSMGEKVDAQNEEAEAAAWKAPAPDGGGKSGMGTFGDLLAGAGTKKQAKKK